MSHLTIGLRALLFVVFAVSALSKLRGREALRELAGSLAGLRLLPAGWAGRIALLIAGAEALATALLATPVREAGLAGMGLAVGLLVVMAAGILLALGRGARVPCRCFGASAAPLGMRHALRNLLLAAAAVAVIPGTAAAAPTGVPPGLAAGDILLAAGAGALLAVVVVTLDDLVALFAAPARRAGG